MKNKLTLEKTIVLHVPVSKVWEALTNSEWTKKYMYGYEVSSDWETGSPIIWTTQIQGKEYKRKGKVLYIEPYKILKVSDFNPDEGIEDIEENYAIVTYELFSEKDGETTLKVTDDCAGNKKKHIESDKFWDTILAKMKSVIES